MVPGETKVLNKCSLSPWVSLPWLPGLWLATPGVAPTQPDHFILGLHFFKDKLQVLRWIMIGPTFSQEKPVWET